MALVKYSDATQEMIKSEEAIEIWKILNGEQEANEEQAKMISVIERVYLNWRNPDTPDSYIEKYRSTIFPVAISRFMADKNFRASRAEPSDTGLHEFCEKWGLTHFGALTPQGRTYAHDR